MNVAPPPPGDAQRPTAAAAKGVGPAGAQRRCRLVARRVRRTVVGRDIDLPAAHASAPFSVSCPATPPRCSSVPAFTPCTPNGKSAVQRGRREPPLWIWIWKTPVWIDSVAGCVDHPPTGRHAADHRVCREAEVLRAGVVRCADHHLAALVRAADGVRPAERITLLARRRRYRCCWVAQSVRDAARPLAWNEPIWSSTLPLPVEPGQQERIVPVQQPIAAAVMCALLQHRVVRQEGVRRARRLPGREIRDLDRERDARGRRCRCAGQVPAVAEVNADVVQRGLLRAARDGQRV